MMRARFWRRRGHLLMIYALIALGSGGLALAAGFVGLMTLAHVVRPG